MIFRTNGKDAWDSWVISNKDGLGTAVMVAAERMANALEAGAAWGKAERAACAGLGISGLQWSCAMQVLRECWAGDVDARCRKDTRRHRADDFYAEWLRRRQRAGPVRFSQVYNSPTL